MKIQLLLFDLAKRTKSGKYFCFFKKTLKWNRLEIELYQTQKLIEQVNHFYSNSNFFREKLNKNGVDVSSIKQLSDLKRIPPLTRAELQNCFDQMVCENSKSKARYSNSSGTTGLPVKYGKDLDGFSSGLAAGYLLWEMAGWKFSYRQLHIWGNPTSVKKWESPMSKLKSWVFRKQNIDSTLTNTTEGLMQVVKTIQRFKPHSIDGYASAIVNLAQFVKDKSINLPKVKIVISTAENLLPSHIKLINETLGPVADLYGCGEINGVAIRKPESGQYVILEPHVIVEKETLGEEGLNEILITDLDNKLIPMIRYKVGDLIDEVFTPNTDSAIQFKYFKQINGRSIDLIKLSNGRIISPINMLAGTLFRKIGGIEKHKVLWDGIKLIFQFVINEKYNSVKTSDEIKAYLEDYEVPFVIEVVTDILPSKNGKYKYFERI